MKTKNFKAGSDIFRASPNKNDHIYRPMIYASYNKNGYNSVKRIYAKFEGNMVHTYRAKRTLKLIDMSIPANIIELRNKARNAATRKSIDKAFRIVNDGQGILRFSRVKYDDEVSKLICELGYDGYIAPKLAEKMSSKPFLQEILICDAGDKLEHVRSNAVTNKPLKPIGLKTQTRTEPITKVLSRFNYNDNGMITPTGMRKFNFNNNNNGLFMTPSPAKKAKTSLFDRFNSL